MKNQFDGLKIWISVLVATELLEILEVIIFSKRLFSHEYMHFK